MLGVVRRCQTVDRAVRPARGAGVESVVVRGRNSSRGIGTTYGDTAGISVSPSGHRILAKSRGFPHMVTRGLGAPPHIARSRCLTCTTRLFPGEANGSRRRGRRGPGGMLHRMAWGSSGAAGAGGASPDFGTRVGAQSAAGPGTRGPGSLLAFVRSSIGNLRFLSSSLGRRA